MARQSDVRCRSSCAAVEAAPASSLRTASSAPDASATRAGLRSAAHRRAVDRADHDARDAARARRSARSPSSRRIRRSCAYLVVAPALGGARRGTSIASISSPSSAPSRRPGHEIGGCDRSPAPARRVDLRLQRDHGRQPVRGRIGQRERAADRAAVADRAVGDAAATAASGRCWRPGHGRPRTPVRDQRAIATTRRSVATFTLRCAPRSTISSSGASRRFSIGTSDWPPARRARAAAWRGRSPHLRPTRAVIGKWRGLHARHPRGRDDRRHGVDAPSRRCRAAARSHRGSVPASRRLADLAPSGRSASLTAFMTAAGGAMAPPSPMPLMPKRVCGDGVSMCSTRTSGTSVGARDHVVEEGRGQRLAVVVVGNLLVERGAEPCATPPTTCASTIMGFTIVPQS